MLIMYWLNSKDRLVTYIYIYTIDYVLIIWYYMVQKDINVSTRKIQPQHTAVCADLIRPRLHEFHGWSLKRWCFVIFMLTNSNG